MANKKHFSILEQGANVWNKWRKQHPEIKPDLKGIDLGIGDSGRNEEDLKQRHLDEEYINFITKSIKLTREGLKGINFSNTDLRGANLWKVNLSYADMKEANLQGAYLRDTNFYMANLQKANFRKSLLRETILRRTCLDETDFSESEITYTRFQDTDISTTKGLDKARWGSAPIINVTTIFLSKGHIAEGFLRDASVPMPLITYSKSLASHNNDTVDSINSLEVSPLKLFLCYAKEDRQRMKQLVKHLEPLKREGLIDIWSDREIAAGEDYEQKILQTIDTSNIFLALISPDFMSSDYCNEIEVKRALKRHVLGEIRIIPIILRPVDWRISPFKELQALPEGGKAITDWKTIDKGLMDVAAGIRIVAEKLRQVKGKFAPEISVLDEKKGFELLSLGFDTGLDDYYWEALEALKRAIHFNPYNMNAWSGVAEVWFLLKRYQDALQICDRVLHVPTETPRYWATYNIKANVLEALGDFEVAKQIRENVNRMEAEQKKENGYYHWMQSLD